jgi:hypothetical protein
LAVPTNSFFFSIILIFFLGCCSITLGQRSKDCENPPGGRITCESSQAAVCKVKEGKVDGYCKTPRKRATEAEVKADLLTLILDKEIKPQDIELNPEYQRIIKEGRVEVNGEVITFSLPDLSEYIEEEQIIRPERKEQRQPNKPPDEGTKPNIIINPPKDTQKVSPSSRPESP